MLLGFVLTIDLSVRIEWLQRSYHSSNVWCFKQIAKYVESISNNAMLWMKDCM